jgi:hypothetical protein
MWRDGEMCDQKKREGERIVDLTTDLKVWKKWKREERTHVHKSALFIFTPKTFYWEQQASNLPQVPSATAPWQFSTPHYNSTRTDVLNYLIISLKF